MIARPLDLASRLRPPPRHLDALFYVTVGLIALNFTLFGSRFVLAPGLGLNFELPSAVGARAGAFPTTHHISVTQAGLIFADEGNITLLRLEAWLRQEAEKTRDPALLVRASVGVTNEEMVQIVRIATNAGFRVQWAVEEPGSPQFPAVHD